jgi:hypothetical protein
MVEVTVRWSVPRTAAIKITYNVVVHGKNRHTCKQSARYNCFESIFSFGNEFKYGSISENETHK